LFTLTLEVIPMKLVNWITALLLIATHVAPAFAQADPLKDVFHHDFRGNGWPDTLIFYGDMEGEYLRAEREGVRITLPKSYSGTHPWGGVGLLTSFGISMIFMSNLIRCTGVYCRFSSAVSWRIRRRTRERAWRTAAGDTPNSAAMVLVGTLSITLRQNMSQVRGSNSLRSRSSKRL
jgi:hypothetical protein